MFENLNREDGQGLVEYALILVLVAIVVIAILLLLEPALKQAWPTIEGQVTNLIDRAQAGNVILPLGILAVVVVTVLAITVLLRSRER